MDCRAPDVGNDLTWKGCCAMKARIAKEREKVLLYRLAQEEENGAKVRRLLRELGMEMIDVAAEQLGWTLGSLAGKTGFAQNKAESISDETPSDEALVMVGLTDDRIDRVMAGLRDVGAKVRLKAVLTPTNQHWSFARLLTELSKEERLMSALMPMQRHLAQVEALDPATISPEEREQADRAAALAKRILAGKQEPEMKDILAADQALLRVLEDSKG